MATPAPCGMRVSEGKARPLVRAVKSRYAGPLVVAMTDEGVTIRPPRTRKGGGSEVYITWGALYDRLILASTR